MLGRVTMPRLTVLHQNIPNVIGAITGILAEAGLNIENMVNQSRGAYAYTVLDMSDKPSGAALAAIDGLEAIYRVRLLVP